MNIINIFLFIIIFFIISYKSESFSNLEEDKQDILSDNQFKDLISYKNEIKNGELVELGIHKCVENCNGYCVEYGITGDSICFSEKK